MEESDPQVATVFERRLLMRPEDKDASLYELLRGWVTDCPRYDTPMHDSAAAPPARFLKFGSESGAWRPREVRELCLTSGGRRRQERSVEELREESLLRFRDAADKVQRRRAEGYRSSRALLDRLCIPRHKFLEGVLEKLDSEGSAAGSRKRGRDDEDAESSTGTGGGGAAKRRRDKPEGG